VWWRCAAGVNVNERVNVIGCEPRIMPFMPQDLPPVLIERPRLSDAVYQQLLNDIMAQRLSVGERLPPETQLAQRFKVSRPVVREALQRLQNDGIVQSRQGSGSFVQRSPSQRVGELTQTFSLHEVLQSFELRMAIEALSARLAARHRTEAQLRHIELAANAVRAGFEQGTPLRDADYSFHRAKNGMDVTLSITREAAAPRRTRVLDEHDRIVNGIRVGDGDSAAIAMCYHLDQARSRLLDGRLDR
jgi:GntR family transcriptional regulator, transcriptional repressor for pyruvate dehydrogenase complex